MPIGASMPNTPPSDMPRRTGMYFALKYHLVRLPLEGKVAEHSETG